MANEIWEDGLMQTHQFYPSPLEGEGGVKHRMRGLSAIALATSIPLILRIFKENAYLAHKECAIHLLPQGEKGR